MYHCAHISYQLDTLVGLSAGCIEGYQTIDVFLAIAYLKTNYLSII